MKTPWGPVAGVLVGLGVFIGSQIGVAIAFALALRGFGPSMGLGDDWISESVIGQFLFILIAEVAAIGGIIWYIKHRGGTLAQIGLNRPTLWHVVIALAGFGAYFVAYIVVALLASALLPVIDVDQRQDIGFETAVLPPELLLTFVSLAILPPLAEEIVFRGFMFAGLRRAWPFITATLITSVVFAAGHLLGGMSGEPLLWIAAIDTFVLSLVLCYLREKSGSLWPSIYVHGIKNSMAFSVLFLFN